jgi:hypothetical protein
MSDITGEGYAALFMAGVLTKQEVRDAIGFGGPATTADSDPSQSAPMQFAPQQIQPQGLYQPTTAATQPAQQFATQQIVAPQAIPPKQLCPTHGVSRLVPSGVTKQGPRAGQIYPAFWACDTAKGVCSWKA